MTADRIDTSRALAAAGTRSRRVAATPGVGAPRDKCG